MLMSFSKLVRWGGLSVLVFVVCVVLVYIFGFFGWERTGFNWAELWDLTGFSGTKLWHWLNLLIVPAALAISVFLFNRAQSRRQQATEEQRAQNAALQSYLDHVGDLLADKKLSMSQPDEDACTVARARTLTVLNSLAPNGKRNVLQFLYQSKLINKEQTVIDIEGANLSRANLSGVVLGEASLGRAILSGANLRGAVLRKADLSEAILGSYEELRATPPNVRSTRFEGYVSRVSMSGADLRGADLFEADLRRTKLFDTDLREADLRGTNLLGADLRRAALRNGDLRGANLRAAKLFGTGLRGSDLRDANLRDADLREANLLEADLRGADLNGADLRGANLRGTKLFDTDLGEADLRGASLLDADLSEAALRGASLSGVSLRSVSLSGASLRGANLGHTNLRDAKLNRADLREANLFEADLRGADLNGADLREANLSRAKLFGTDLKGADLRSANLFEADLRRAVLRDLDLSEANLSRARLFGTDLSGSDLNRAKLFGTDLSGADLRGADLHRAVVNHADLSGADLRGADLHHVGMSYADLHGADLDGADSVISSSRDSLAGAGWFCGRVEKPPSAGRPFSWINPVPLWQSRNQVLAGYFGDPTNDERRRWMEVQRKVGKLPANLTIKDHADLEEVSFLVLGDTGEGDASQYAVVKPLLARGRDTHFLVICSDVIYPAGDIEDYEAKFYEPYKDYQRPIYALPGNHDWYDGLNGFMYHLCGTEASALAVTEDRALSWKERLRRLLWRKPKVAPSRLPERERTEGDPRSKQRSPYLAIEAGPLLIVGIDTGISGDIDREQGGWLRKISRESDKPKILLTGKPIYVDGEYHPGMIEGGGTVDEIVRDPEHNYVAVIGGDTHNYQRYRVKVEGREDPIHYIVSGGGGAFMHATHKIPKVELDGVDEDDFVCYPRRGDSLSFYSKLYDREFGLGKGWLEIPPDEAAAYMGERLGIAPEREEDRKAYISRRTRRLAKWIFPLPGRGRGFLHYYFSEFFDWNDPPLFKNFLRIDASESELQIRCCAATGCLEHEKNPPVEDEIKIKLATLASGRTYR